MASCFLAPADDTVFYGAKHFIENVCTPEQRELMCQMLDESRRPHSLRLIEHFFLKYLDAACLRDPEIMDVYEKYNRITDSFGKGLFDCFAREGKFVEIEINGRTYVSTPGQLNFFRWFVKHDFLPIIARHIDEISQQMTQERMRQRKRAAATLAMYKEQETEPITGY